MTFYEYEGNIAVWAIIIDMQLTEGDEKFYRF